MDEAASLAYVEELSEQLKNSLDHVSEADFPAFFEEMTKKLNKMYVETKKQYDEWQAVAAADEKCLSKCDFYSTTKIFRAIFRWSFD